MSKAAAPATGATGGVRSWLASHNPLAGITSAARGVKGRISSALHRAHAQSADRLAHELAAANRATYLATMQHIAQQFGATPPQDVTDHRAVHAITERARVSAQSIAQTRAHRMADLVQQYGSRPAAQGAFDAWDADRKALMSQYEAQMTAHQALEDFHDRNAALLSGTEHLEPGEARTDDECQEAIDAGEVEIGTLGVFPAHARCPHWVVRSYDAVDDPDQLWLGE